MPKPFFQICEDCGHHGRIVLREGVWTSEAPSKEVANFFVGIAYRWKEVTLEQMIDLLQEIKDSSLPAMASVFIDQNKVFHDPKPPTLH